MYIHKNFKRCNAYMHSRYCKYALAKFKFKIVTKGLINASAMSHMFLVDTGKVPSSRICL